MLQSFKQAVADVSEIMQFENWLRFYFLREEDDQLIVRIPDAAMEHFRLKYPHLAPLAEIMNNQTIDYEQSVRTVCKYVVTKLDGPVYREGIVPGVLDSSEFQKEMYLFQLWCQKHEDQLEQTPMEFATWKQLFEDWKKSDAVQKVAKQSSEDAKRVTNCSTDAVQ